MWGQEGEQEIAEYPYKIEDVGERRGQIEREIKKEGTNEHGLS